MASQGIARKTRLKFIQEAIKEADIQQEQPASSTETTGETLNFARWFDQAHNELQLMRDWLWRREQVEFHLPGLIYIFTFPLRGKFINLSPKFQCLKESFFRFRVEKRSNFPQ